jgi:hypothetical protein
MLTLGNQRDRLGVIFNSISSARYMVREAQACEGRGDLEGAITFMGKTHDFLLDVRQGWASWADALRFASVEREE